VQTEDLIQQLTAEAKPVRPLPSLVARLAGWLVLAAASLAIVMLLMGVRRELGDAADRADFAVEAALLILTALSAAVGTLVVSIPGAERTAVVRWLPVIAAVTYVMWSAGELAFAAATGAPTGRIALGWHCIYKTASIAVVPSLALFVLVRRAAPLRAVWAGLLALLATAAVGVLGANVICPNDRPVHMLLWHVFPLMVFAGVGAALGTWLFRWPRR
jgi:hypothetical protein